jgi:hypothetical protein
VVYQRHKHPSIPNRHDSVVNKSESANIGYLWGCSQAWRPGDRIVGAETRSVASLWRLTLRVYPIDIHVMKTTHMVVNVVVCEYAPHGTASKLRVFCTHNSIRTTESHGETNTIDFANSHSAAHHRVITQIQIPFSYGSLLVVSDTLSDSFRSLK